VYVAYREMPPPHDLAHLVRCFWIRTGTGDDTLVLPDGCLDVIVRDGQAIVAGPDTGPVPGRIAPGEVVTGLRLRPGAGGAVLRIDAGELRDVRVLEAARRLARAPGTPVPALAAEVRLGERHLRRRFAAAVGYGPKTFARVARFRAALGLVRSGESLAAAALAAGYADQAHMTRELVALSGRTPGSLRV